MNESAQHDWDDRILPFQLDRSDIRGRVARMDGVLDQVLSQHDYPPVVEALVAEAVLLTALIGQAIKLRWKLSLQIRSDDGPIRMIATDYFGPGAKGDPARLRAYANFDRDALVDDIPAIEQLGSGIFGILIDQGPDMTPYQGMTPLTSKSLADCAETYFAQSEQIPTRFALAMGQSQAPGTKPNWRAGGIMLQHMPKPSPSIEGPMRDDGLLSAADLVDGDNKENWSRVNILLDTVDELELVGPFVSPTQLLYRLFHEEAARVFDSQKAEFGCTCSQQRVEQSISGFSEDSLEDMLTDDGMITADCQFCSAHYEIDPKTLVRAESV